MASLFSARDVARRDRTQRKNLFAKSKNQKHTNQKFEKRTNAKSKNKNFSGNFEIGKTDRGSKEAAMFSIDLELSRSPAKPVTEMPEACETLDVPRYISPLMRPPSMKRLSPSLPYGPTFLRRSVVGSISNRGRNYEPAPAVVLQPAELKVAREVFRNRGCMSAHGRACATSTPLP
jgi:hypothetical protein